MLLVIILCLFLNFEINHCKVNVTKPVINKCCSMKKYITLHKTKPYKRCEELGKSNFTNVVIYDKKYKITSESLESVFDIKPGKFTDTIFKQLVEDFKNTSCCKNYNLYLTKESGLIMEIPNIYDRFKHIKYNDFCYDYTKNEYDEIVPRFWVNLHKPASKEPSSNDRYKDDMLISSVVFLLLVMIVYALLPELRNLCGMILMAYVSSLFVAFVLLATIRMKTFNNNMCIHLTCAIYFFLLATFCWMTVMSYDIWWTFRGYAKARPIHRRGEWFKFSMYAIYGYGVPLAMTIFLRVINDVDLDHMPWFIKPGIPEMGCFITDGQKLVYLYIPMMILLLGNWMFYLMTAFNMWRLSRGTAVLDSAAAGTPAAHRTHRQRFLVYLKLSVVMGLNWVLEVGSFLLPSWNKLWCISDAYNLLIGVFMFVIFVCKPRILKKLIKSFKTHNFKKWVPLSSTRSNSSSKNNSTSQETQTMQVCTDPKGPVYTAHKF